MTFIQDTISNVIIGISSNAFLMLVIWVTGKRIVKEVPKWLDTYHNNQMKEIALRRADEWSRK